MNMSDSDALTAAAKVCGLRFNPSYRAFQPYNPGCDESGDFRSHCVCSGSVGASQAEDVRTLVACPFGVSKDRTLFRKAVYELNSRSSMAKCFHSLDE
jgi:hypothetical protein